VSDALQRLAAAAPPNSASAAILQAKLAQQQQVEAAPTPGVPVLRAAVPQTAAQAAYVTSAVTGTVQAAAPVSAAEVEAVSRLAVTVEEGQAYGLTLAQYLALAALHNEQDLGVPTGHTTSQGYVSDAVDSSVMDSLDALGLVP
jgi:hypothetical protein